MLVKSDVNSQDNSFYNGLAARDTSGEMCWKRLCDPPQTKEVVVVEVPGTGHLRRTAPPLPFFKN